MSLNLTETCLLQDGPDLTVFMPSGLTLPGAHRTPTYGADGSPGKSQARSVGPELLGQKLHLRERRAQMESPT